MSLSFVGLCLLQFYTDYGIIRLFEIRANWFAKHTQYGFTQNTACNNFAKYESFTMVKSKCQGSYASETTADIVFNFEFYVQNGEGQKWSSSWIECDCNQLSLWEFRSFSILRSLTGCSSPTFRYYLVATLPGKMNWIILFCSYLSQTFEPCPFLFDLWNIYIYIITIFSCILLAWHAHALPSQNILYATSLGCHCQSTFNSVHIFSSDLQSYTFSSIWTKY